MSDPLFITPEPISLKDIPNFNESILRDMIVNDPAILGLGELEVKDKERMQSGAGRLDILLIDPESEERYEVGFCAAYRCQNDCVSDYSSLQNLI